MSSDWYFGGKGRSVECGGVLASESTYPARLALPRHSHAHAHLCLVLSGRYEETLAGAREARRPMMLIYYPPDCPHAESHHAPGRHFLVDWDEQWAARVGFDSTLLSRPAVVDPSAAVLAALRAFQLLHRGEAEARLHIEDALISILSELDASGPRLARRAPKWLAAVMGRLRESPNESLSLVELASEAKVHPSHLARSFKQFVGCTPGDMRRRFQVERACRGLAGGSDALCHVAVDAGFSDQSHMTRAVREATGFTPGELRSAVATDSGI